MATQLFETAEDHILNYLKGTAMPTAPTLCQIALFSADFANSSTLPAEIVYTGYARQTVTLGAITANTSIGAGDSVSNSATVSFPATPATGGPWTISAYALFFNTGTSGTYECWHFENLTAPISVGNSSTISFAAGAITATQI